MTSQAINRIAVCLSFLAALSTAAHAAGGSPAKLPYLTSVKPEPDKYLFTGVEAFRLPEGGDTYFAIPVDGRFITNGDFEAGIGSTFLKGDVAGSSKSGIGDSAVWISQGTRDLPFANFASIDIAKIIDTADDGFSSETEARIRLRALGGPTRFGYDASVSYDFGTDDAFGGDKAIYSLGFRSQFGRIHIGMDWIHTDRQTEDDLDSIDLLLMHRYFDGSSAYAVIEKGVSSGNEGWYVGFGYDWRLGL